MKNMVLGLWLMGILSWTVSAAQGQKLREVLVRHYPQEHVNVFVDFCVQNLPGVIQHIEARLPEDLNVEKLEPEKQAYLRDLVEDLVEFYKEYREQATTSPGEADLRLQYQRARSEALALADSWKIALDGDRDRIDKNLHDVVTMMLEYSQESLRNQLQHAAQEERSRLERLVALREASREVLVELKILRLLHGEEILAF